MLHCTALLQVPCSRVSVEGFTPDHKPIMGELPGVSGLWMAAAFNSSGIMLGTLHCTVEPERGRLSILAVT